MVISEVYLSQFGNKEGRGEKRKNTKTKTRKELDENSGKEKGKGILGNERNNQFSPQNRKEKRMEWTEKNDDGAADPSRNLSSLSEEKRLCDQKVGPR